MRGEGAPDGLNQGRGTRRIDGKGCEVRVILEHRLVDPAGAMRCGRS